MNHTNNKRLVPMSMFSIMDMSMRMDNIALMMMVDVLV
jgi:hypothetical protein